MDPRPLIESCLLALTLLIVWYAAILVSPETTVNRIDTPNCFPPYTWGAKGFLMCLDEVEKNI